MQIEQEPPRPSKPVQAGFDQSVRLSCRRVELRMMATSAVTGQSCNKSHRGPKTQVLIVEHDGALAKLIKSYLEHEGYDVSVVGTLSDTFGAVETGKVDLIILSAMLPDAAAWSVLRWIRVLGEIPVLALTGKCDTMDRVIALELGADDSLAAPLDLRELVARLRSIERRAVRPPPDAGPAADGVFRFPGWVLDPSSEQLTTETGEVVHLTQIEYRILVLLIHNPGRTVTRDQLMAAATGRDWTPFDRNIDVHISNLRRKLDGDPTIPSLIRSVRGAGYMFVPSHGS